MNRRRFLCASLAGGASALSGFASAHGEQEGFLSPSRFVRPESGSDEGGWWAMMDREEQKLKRSHHLLRDTKLKEYVQGLACRLGGEHCPDIRVHLVRNPVFNATMAPNGMMQVWTGLLLRVDNEAQLAAVLGHEIAHYLQRHGLDRLRDLKSKSAFGQFLGLFGLVGLVGQLAVVASAFSYGREHEREADRIGAFLMHQAGYDVGEASVVWGNLLDELRARHGKEPGEISPLFATHPTAPERRDTLAQLASALPNGEKGEERFVAACASQIPLWLSDEVKRGQYAESLALFDRLVHRNGIAAQVHFHRGEAYRLRGEGGDLDRALSEYLAASRMPNSPAEAFRGIGFVARQRGQIREAVQAFSRYLELAPDAPDISFIRSYVVELGT